ncbi:MAG: alpha/beta hydrolase, partial [Oscillospiraceae bacterium]|nr:alpha/beta hydrolase [Oscillospiraceae bacterium]
MIYKFPVTIPQLSGNEQRMLYVYTPKGYERNRRKRYPVLYLFDGHNVFYDKDAAYGKSWGVGKYLDRTRTQLIVVAIECEKTGGRLSEYSPFDFSDPKYGNVKGRAK